MRSLLISVRRALAGAGEVVRYALVFVWAIFCPKAVLAGRLLAAESQLAACEHEIASKRRPRPRFTPGFRRLWVVLSKCLDRWEDLAQWTYPGPSISSRLRRSTSPRCMSSLSSTTADARSYTSRSHDIRIWIG